MTILLIAGSDDRRASVKRALAGRGYDIHTCGAIAVGEQYIADFAPTLTMICEISTEAVDLCRRIRSAESLQTAVVFLDPAGNENSIEAAVRAGADDVVFPDSDDRWVMRSILWARKYGAGEVDDGLSAVGAGEVSTDGRDFDHQPLEVRIDEGSGDISLEHRLEQQRQLAQLGVAALKEPDELALMGRITESARKMLQVDASMVFEPVEGEDAFALKAGVGWDRAIVGHATILNHDREQVGYTLRSRSPIAIDDFRKTERFDPSSLLERHDIVSGLTVPIEGYERPHGVLGVFSQTVREFGEYEVHLLQLMANILGERIEQRRAERQLRNSERRAKAVLDTTVDAIITIDEMGHIESFNQAAENIFGYAAEEVIGENVKLLMPSPYRDEHDHYLENYRETGEPKIIGVGREVVGRRKDGSTFPLQLSVSEVQLKDERLFTGIIRDLSEKKRLEKEILRISEEERRRIGQDLHDGLGQMLNAIALFSETLAEQLEELDTDLAERARFITEKIREADEQARNLGRGLVMVNIEKDGLAGALKRLCANAEELYGISCRLKQKGELEVEDETIDTHLYRIAQEAINNAVRHGEATEIVVTIASGSEYLRLRIKDNGAGFPDELDENTSGMGVPTMHYRAHLIGGSLHIQSNPSGGTIVTCTLPLEEPRRMTVTS
jgi:PAS domain S-box-containing protein